MASYNWPPQGGSGGGITKVANAAARLALSPADGDIVIQLDNDTLYEYDSTLGQWLVIGSATVVEGPASSTNNAITRFDGTTGRLLQNSSTLLDDSGNITFPDLTGIESSVTGSTLNIGTGTNTDTVNIGTGTNTQTIAIGSGVGATTINIGAAGDTVNVAGDVFNVITTNLNVTDKTILLNDGAVGSGTARGAGINIRDNNVDAQSFLRIDGSTGTSWEIKAPEAVGIFTIIPGASGFSINQGVATTDSPTFVSATLSGVTASLPLKVNGSKLITSGAIDLNSSEITGTLQIGNGGTGSATKNFVDLSTTQTVGGSKTFSSSVSISTNTNQLALGTTNTTTYTMASLTGSRVFTTPDANSNSLQPLGSATANNWIQYIDASGVQHLLQPSFTNISGTVVLTSQVSGILPIANGGTNSDVTLNNNRFIISVSGSLVEAAAVTANRALISDSNGLPTHSVTTATELSYVNGVTSAIQTQLNGKEKNWTVTAISSNVTLADHSINLVDTSSARSLTLPTPASGIRIKLKDKTGSMLTNNITLVRAGTEKIETVAASYTLDSNLQAVEIVSDGTDWFII